MPIGRNGEPGADTLLTLETLGAARLFVGTGVEGKPALEAGKPLALVAYLATVPGRQARREQLVDVLWADLEPDAAKHALRQTLWYLRKRVGEVVVTASGDLLSVGPRLVVDRDQLLEAASANQHDRVLAIYRGEFFPGFAAPGGAGFEAWADVERRRLRGLFERSVEAVVRDFLGRGRAREAIQQAQRARDADPTRQANWRLLIEALMSAREWTQAQVEADAFERLMIAEEVGLDPASRAQLRLARQGAGEPDRDGGSASASTGRESAGVVAALVGREREFALLLEGVSRAQQGRGEHLHLRAPAGLGKSRLLGDVQARLRSTRTRSVLVRCDPGSRELPFAAASEVALALGRLPGARGISPESAAALVAMAPALSSHFTAASDRSGGSEALRRRSQALVELAAAVSEEQAVVVLVDDVHWMDRSSRTVLTQLAARVGALRVLLATSGRAVREGVLDGTEPRVIELAPLTEAQCGELLGSIATLGGGEWAGPLVHDLWRSSAGSPLQLLETLQLLRERGWLEVVEGEWRVLDAGALFTLLREGGALARRLDGLPREQRWMLLVLGVAGRAVEGEVLAAGTGGNDDAHRESLEALERRGLVARAGTAWEVAHDEIAAAALERATSDGVTAAHTALGRALWQRSSGEMPDLCRAAQHLAQGSDVAALRAVFQRYVRRSHGLGDARPLPILAEELVGRHAVPHVVRDMVSALPWHVRVGLTSRRRMVAVAALLLAVVLAPASYVMARSAIASAPPPMAELLLLSGDAEEARMARVPLRAGEWLPGRPIEVTEFSPSGLRGWGVGGRLARHPQLAGRWFMSDRVAGTDNIEVFLVGGGERRRITDAEGDDMVGDVSPDGRHLVVTTERWNAEAHYDLALVRLATGATTPITQGDETDGSPRWNQAGDRLAFVRSSWADGQSRVCVVAPDGSDLWCPVPWTGLSGVVGWIDEETLLVERGAGGATDLLVASLPDTSLRPLGEKRRGLVELSPDGRWVVCQCVRPTSQEGTWFVLPVDRPADARALQVTTVVSQAYWSAEGRPAAPSALRIDVGPGPPQVGVPHQFEARDVMGAQGGGAVARARWRSLDTATLVIEAATGVAYPRAVGTVPVEVRLLSGLRTIDTVQVVDAASRLRGRETWDTTWTSRWFTFGRPRPRVVERDGERHFHNSGDGKYLSGATSLDSIPTARGVAVETRVSLRLTRHQWQVVRVGLGPARDLSRISADERETGLIWQAVDPMPSCTFGLPGGEGPVATRTISLIANREAEQVPLPSGADQGAWIAIRLQLFPDGSCGFAINGVPVHRTRAGTLSTPRVQLEVYGSARDTDALVGKVSTYEGVPAGIDWTRVPGRVQR